MNFAVNFLNKWYWRNMCVNVIPKITSKKFRNAIEINLSGVFFTNPNVKSMFFVKYTDDGN
jgi:hypothetical protein